jgi:hypothetical protein
VLDGGTKWLVDADDDFARAERRISLAIWRTLPGQR